VVVAAREQQLLDAVADAGADPRRPAEVERRAGDVGDAGRDQASVDRRVAARVQRQLVIEGGAGAGEVEVAVLAEVDDRRPIGRRAMVDAPGAVGRERVAHRHPHRAGKALVAVGAVQRKLQRDAAVGAARQRLDVPPALSEANRPPCSVFVPSFCTRRYVRPSIAKRPSAMRFA
jgi:hypothetical protein